MAEKQQSLLIHGYLGSPYDVEYLADRLNRKGFTVSVPRLPGHGTNADDFLFIRRKRLCSEKCNDSYMELDSRYEKVVIAGFSMGALLAGYFSKRYSNLKTYSYCSPADYKKKTSSVCVSSNKNFC